MHCRPAFQRAFREWMRVSLVSLDRMWPPVVTGWVWWTSKPVSSTDGAVNSCDAHYLFVSVLVVPASQNVLVLFCLSEVLYMCVVFGVGTDLWKKKAAERRERGRSASFIWRRPRGWVGGGNGVGGGNRTCMGELLCCRVNGGLLSREPFRVASLRSPATLPPPSSLSPSYFFTHSLFARPFFQDLFFPTETVSCVTISQTAFHATQTHILVSLSPLCLWPPSWRGLNSMHYVISVGCVHTAVRCRITMP